jgi:hypothetical protein
MSLAERSIKALTSVASSLARITSFGDAFGQRGSPDRCSLGLSRSAALTSPNSYTPSLKLARLVVRARSP